MSLVPFFYHRARDIAAALGITGLVWSGYSASGLPVPATIYQLDMRIKPIEQSIRDLNVEQIETRRSVVVLRRASLRDQRYTLEAALATADAASKATLTSRIGEIDDELSSLDKQNDALMHTIQQLRAGGSVATP